MDKTIALKKKHVDKMITRLHTLAFQSVQKKQYERALEAIATCAELEYQWNQCYVDEYLEQELLNICAHILHSSIKKRDSDEQTILFYDGFGYDNRGLMINYVENLLTLGYRVIYVTTETAKGKQPVLSKAVKDKNIVWEYLPFTPKCLLSIQYMDALFLKYNPAKAFLYTLPYDVAGITVFSNYGGTVERYQINLTDHAFWLGKYAFDYCLEFRDYGANISRIYRGIEKEKLIKLPFYPYIDYTLEFEGFPFQEKGYKVVFSGGGLYKTFDETNTYYNLVKSILKYDDKVIFLYAGSGDDSRLRELISEFPGRVWHIEERQDLYQLMQKIDIYLNTYPLAGGLMMQYAALASKVPVTIETGEDIDEILVNQKDCRYLFQNPEEALDEIYKLLDDPVYAEQKGKKIKQSVIGKEEFERALRMAVLEHISPYGICEKEVNTEEFAQEYLLRFDLKDLQRIMIKDEHWELRMCFPLLFFKKRLKNFYNLLRTLLHIQDI